MLIVVHATQVSQPMKVYVRVDAFLFWMFFFFFFMEDTKTGYNLDLDVALECLTNHVLTTVRYANLFLRLLIPFCLLSL